MRIITLIFLLSASFACSSTTDNTNSISFDVPGEEKNHWIVEQSTLKFHLILSESSDTLKMTTIFEDNTRMTAVIKQSGDTLREVPANYHGEYYILAADGSLDLYGKEGKFETAKIYN